MRARAWTRYQNTFARVFISGAVTGVDRRALSCPRHIPVCAPIFARLDEERSMRNQAVLPVPRALPLTAKPMPLNTKLLGIVAGVMVAAMIWMIPIAGLPPSGQKALAITTFAVIWWVCGVTHPAYTTLLLFLGDILLLGPVTAPEGATIDIASQVFRLFSLPLMWLMVGAFLIATAVTRSGLATRVAYVFMTRVGKSYRGIVVL